MKKSDLASLTALAALWGASYLFMRVGAGEFGALTLAGARAAIAAALLMPLLAGDLSALRRHWKPVRLVGVTNSALPFVLFFRLIARVGAAKTMAVPFLAETFTAAMAAGSALIVLGTALATGLINPARPPAARPLPRPGARPDANRRGRCTP